MNRTATVVTAGLLGAALTLTGCSSSGGTHTAAAPPNTSRPAGSAAAAPARSSHAGGGNVGGNSWCAEASQAGDAITALGGTSTEAPGAFINKLQKIVDDAPAAVKPDVSAFFQLDKKILAGDKNAELEFATPANLAHIKHFASWLKANCRGVNVDVPSSLPTG